MFRTLVKQGTVVESRAIRFLGDRVETSFTQANTMWRKTRRTVEATVRQAATIDGRLRATGHAEVAAEDRAPEGFRRRRQGEGSGEARAQDGEDPCGSRREEGEAHDEAR